MRILLILSILTPISLGSSVSVLISLAIPISLLATQALQEPIPISLPAIQALKEPILPVASLKQVS